jgi:alkanesulfonate monooxygenase SsuD/methylene tetrahydromethanopterin reductase-like flavin-dependent oxidoreductase (luciferase family)
MLPLALRFDLRNPAFAGTSTTERLQAALDMAEWADDHGAVSIGISEHHGSDDGYLPSPIVFAAALAARTCNARIMIAALIAPLYDPVKLAEDLAVLDALSGGRIDLIIGGGYVADELSMFGVRSAERGPRTSDAIETLRAAWSGEPFEYQGRTVRVTPTPCQPGGPRLVLGGSSDAAARRAARIADGYAPSSGDSWAAYRDEMLALGKPDPGEGSEVSVVTTFLSEDPDAAWTALLPYFLHENNAYARWLDDAGLVGPYRACDATELQRRGQYRVLTPDAYADELRAAPFPFAFFHPLVGGTPPALGWETLHLYADQVLPRLAT